MTSTDYVEFLRTDKDEVQNLFNDLLIGVTQFFRDKREFEILETTGHTQDFSKGGPQVASARLGARLCYRRRGLLDRILLREHMASLDSIPQVQVFATDIDGRALAAARVGRYRTPISRRTCLPNAWPAGSCARATPTSW